MLHNNYKDLEKLIDAFFADKYEKDEEERLLSEKARQPSNSNSAR